MGFEIGSEFIYNINSRTNTQPKVNGGHTTKLRSTKIDKKMIYSMKYTASFFKSILSGSNWLTFKNNEKHAQTEARQLEMFY